MRFLTILSAFLFFVGDAFGIEFTSLSKYKPVEIAYTSTSKTYVTFTLSLTTEASQKSDVFLKAQYIIGTDTLNDYIYTDGEYDGALKQIQLDAGETVAVRLFLNNARQELILGLNGTLEMQKSNDPDILSEKAKFYYPGSIWKRDEPTIFRITKTSSEQKSLILKISVSENYEYDKLFLRAKVISPMQGILELDETIETHSEEFLPYKGKVIEVKFPELHVDKPGNYYLQLSHEHASKRINGIISVAWELR